MKILLASSEAVPFCKTGGLADVAGALLEVLGGKDSQVALFLPFYRQIQQSFKDIKKLPVSVSVPIDGSLEPVELYETRLKSGARVIFIGSARYFDRGGLYGEHPGSTYEDNDRRFALYSRAVLEGAKAIKFQPSVIHGHDWQAGLIPAYLKHVYANDPYFAKTGTVFTIHNMAYQGTFPKSTLAQVGLPDYLFHPQHMEFYGQVSFLKAGLIFSDGVNTVSPTYAKEIQDPAFGCGMEGILQERTKRFRGILNGLDTDLWNPKTDRLLSVNFDKSSVVKRAANRTALQRMVGFAQQDKAPLLSFIGRLDQQKGVDQLIDVLPVLLREGAQFICLGQGHSHLLDGLKALQNQYPSQLFIETRFLEPLAHQIYGGTDLFLMPSRYEPCGLGQMIAMRYGAIPVVTPTGGLVDTVTDAHPPSSGTGFIADNMTPGAVLNAVLRAVNAWKDRPFWLKVQRAAMAQNFSWKNSVLEYRRLYKDAQSWRRANRS